MIMGTTGWENKFDEVKKIINNANVGFIYGSNFSVGMNLFFQINKFTAKLMNKIDDYDIFGYEIHHKKKKDSPSGTAKEITKILLDNIERKKIAQYEKLDREIAPDEIHFSSIRGGEINGTHFVSYDSEADSIELKHIAKSRKGFALGAIMAAEYQVENQIKGIINFKDIFEEIVK